MSSSAPTAASTRKREQILAEMADWIAINGEAIYETRPWLVHGEGPVRAKGGHFKEDFAYTAKDFASRARAINTLYAFALGWPAEGKLAIRSLGKFPGVTGQYQYRRAAWPSRAAHLDARSRRLDGRAARDRSPATTPSH